MKSTDYKLGMHRPISRRDILHGIGALSAGALTVGSLSHSTALAQQILAVESNNAPLTNNNYPPALTGMQGNHAGAFEVAHQLARKGRKNWGNVEEPDSEVYDLVVVGGGISGLSAAHFYHKENPKAHILILDNHDDFGGHAKRNEFQVGGRTMLAHGGSQTLAEPSSYSKIVKGLLHDLGVDIKRFDTAYDQDFFKRHGLRGGLHFNKEKWGVDRTVPFDLGFFEGYIPVSESDLTAQQAVAMIPISEAAQREFLRLLTTREDQIPHIPADEKWEYLSSISYRDFLIKHMGITEPEVFDVLQNLPSDAGVGIEACSTYRAVSWYGLPGWDWTGLPLSSEESEPSEVTPSPGQPENKLSSNMVV